MAAVILKARNQHMSALHHIIGQILDYGGATDETINILNNLGLSIGAQSVYLKKADLVKQQKAKIKTIAIDPTKKSELQSKLDVSEKALKPVEKQTDTKPICFPPKLEDHAPLHDQERASFEQGKTNLLNIDNNLSVSGMSYTLCCPQVDVVDSNESSNKVADASDLNDLKAKRIETKSGFIQFPSVQSCISTEEFSDYTSANLQKSQKIYQMCLDRNSTILESPLTRFEIIGDNIDLNVSPSSMSTEKRTKSLHWFLNVALTRRILSSLPNDQPKDDILRTPNGTFLPDPDDCKHLDTNMVHHIATVLCRHVPLFMKFKKAIPEYISHPFVEELSKKSEFRIADLLDKSENKTDEMITILEHIHQYYVAQTDSVPPAVIERLVFGGDVLTNERAYSAQLAMINGDTDADRLAGVVHRPEGLHRMMNLLTTIYRLFYKPTSATDQGSLFQLRNMVHRTDVSGADSVTEKLRSHMSFVQDCLDAYIIGSALELLQMEKISDEPKKNQPPFLLELAPIKDQQTWVFQFSQKILDVFVKCDNSDITNSEVVAEMDQNERLIAEMFDGSKFTCECGKTYKKKGFFKRHLEKEHNWNFQIDENERTSSKQDYIATYRSSFMKLALILRDTEDAYRMGDGDRIFRNAKFEMLCADVSHHTKYRLWLWRMLAYFHAILSPRDAEEYKWNCTASIKGGTGANIPNDNLVELMVQKVKKKLREQGSNITYQSARTAALSTQIQDDVFKNTKIQFTDKKRGQSKPTVEKSKDLEILIQELKGANVFQTIPGREYTAFKDFKEIFSRVKVADIHSWITKQKERASIEMF